MRQLVRSRSLRLYKWRPARLVTQAYFQAIDAGVRLILTEYDARAVHLDCAEATLRNLIDIFHKSCATDPQS